MKYAIGVDLGGTGIKAGLVSSDGKIIKICETPTEAKKGTKKVISNIISSIEKVKSGKISGIGIGSPGPFDFKTGKVLNPVNLPFRNLPLRVMIQKRFKIKTCLDNDANCFALGEAIFGSGKYYENVVGITLGTGIGGGFIINKNIYHGRSNAAELGHITINYDGPKSACGNKGCIETYAAARGIMSLYDKKSEPKYVQDLAFNGNKKAIEVYKNMGHFLGVGITNIIYAFDPDIIVVGGKISNSWPLFKEAMDKTIKERYFAKPCPVVRSKLKYAGILGAAALVMIKC
jgi:glucokinase